MSLNSMDELRTFLRLKDDSHDAILYRCVEQAEREVARYKVASLADKKDLALYWAAHLYTIATGGQAVSESLDGESVGRPNVASQGLAETTFGREVLRMLSVLKGAKRRKIRVHPPGV